MQDPSFSIQVIHKSKLNGFLNAIRCKFEGNDDKNLNISASNFQLNLDHIYAA